MKDREDAIIQSEQAAYLSDILPARDALLTEMEAYSAEHHVPSSDPEVALFLAITAKAINARRALEFGTAIGYGAITLARAMDPEGRVTTIEPSDEKIETARRFIERAGLTSQIEIVKGKALDVIPQLDPGYDLAYIDAVKEEYTDYLNVIIPKMRIGGVILADNVLWKGQVASGKLRSPEQEESTNALREFNHVFTTHPQLTSIILPLGDGLAYGIRIATIGG
jgi:caffeoyl-CoA O-methyltransferase